MAKVIMVQGTMSNAGKSLIVAGLCRIFRQDGYRVAPFKSQNMALNSFITEDGLELGRAQAMQCEAAGIAPSVLMNPILLKPTNDIGSQVIVNGEVLGNFSAKEYFRQKKTLLPEVKKAYDALAEQYDIIVIEGAGSPAELNLKADDIVNMGMAEVADAPVVLVGDIDRGGVFAQLIGTVALLEKQEQNRIQGLIVNKFRGDVSLFQEGIRLLEEKSGKKVLGVVPYVAVDIEEEDSLSERFEKRQEVGLLDIAVIRFPRISNYTDVQCLEAVEGVSVRYVTRTRELGTPDMILLLGSKNTIEDLLWMRQGGLESAVLKLAKADTVVFGICGGYQMMGETLSDPLGIECQGSVRGMGLLPVETVFTSEKKRTRAKGTFLQVKGTLQKTSFEKISGYEIHMGETKGKEQVYFTELYIEGEPVKKEGCQKGNCYGTYLHGVFDTEEATRTVLSALCEKKGISLQELRQDVFDWQAYKEKQYDILAETLRNSLDMKAIYNILEGRTENL